MIEHVEILYQTLFSVGYQTNELKLSKVKNGFHNEALWQLEFRNFYEWIS